jgi:DNA invertase Pin-like site-specific DNA recombinase
MAEDERGRIIKRTHEGRKIAQARGVKMGRKEKLNDKQKAEARQLARYQATSRRFIVSVGRRSRGYVDGRWQYQNYAIP